MPCREAQSRIGLSNMAEDMIDSAELCQFQVPRSWPITLKILELVKSLPAADQRIISQELAKNAAGHGQTPSRKLARLPDGGYYNPDGIPNDDPVFKILEEIEQERHRTPGPPPPDFD